VVSSYCSVRLYPALVAELAVSPLRVRIVDSFRGHGGGTLPLRMPVHLLFCYSSCCEECSMLHRGSDLDRSCGTT
jgi:hypothetical protein